MVHVILPVGMLQCNCSVLGDETTGEALVVDPGDEVSRILEIIAEHKLKITGIVITHAHIDHIGGARKLKAATGAPIYMNAKDDALQDTMDSQAGWIGVPTPERVEIDVDAREGGSLRIGETEFRILDTPGHTQGSISLWIPTQQKLLAGDTLFAGSIGRTDLPGGDSRQILRSIRDKFLVLPDETLVLPGHGEETTIGREKQFNYFLQGL